MASRPTRLRRPYQQHEQQPRAKWTASLTKILADLMVDQVRKGNRQNNSFGKKAWKYMCDDFFKKTGLKWDKEQLKNRYAVLRRQYVIVKSLLDQSDFNWDENTGIITAKDEAWDNYIKKIHEARFINDILKHNIVGVPPRSGGSRLYYLFIVHHNVRMELTNQEHPDAESMRSAGCPIYKQLCTIFSESGANGTNEQSAEHEEGIPYEYPCPEPLSMHREESSSESDDVAEMADGQDNFQSTLPTGISSRKRGRRGIDNVIAGAILEMAAASKLRTAAIKQRNAKFSITNCVQALDEIQGVDERVYFAALDLFDNPNAREIFLSLKSDKRYTWLCGKCTFSPS